VATGYTRDPQGRLLLAAQPSLAEGRSWSLAKAAQLIRNDARPHRWVALQQDRSAWGLFWAGGGLQHCRELLLDLEVEQPRSGSVSRPAKPLSPLARAINPWKVMAWTSLAWLTVLSITVAGFLAVLERQGRQLELLLERTSPASPAP
jgi:hypothetical protein